MPQSELNRLDLSTINAIQSVITAAIEHQVCKWEQESADCASDGRLINALQYEHWAFAASILRTITSSELTRLFGKVVEIQFSSAPPLE